jgi:hypothetical protein
LGALRRILQQRMGAGRNRIARLIETPADDHFNIGSDPHILIFDEAISALDYESERIIQDNIQRICAHRTFF